MADLTADYAVYMQRVLMLKFNARRMGDSRPLNEIIYDARYRDLRVPNRTAWIEEWPWLRQHVANLNKQTRERFRYREPEDGNEAPRAVVPQQAKDLSRQQMRGLARRLARQRIRYCKTIGWGGMGVVTLWKYETNNAEKAMVIKSSLLSGNNQAVDPITLFSEKDFLRQLARAPHVSQLQLLQALGTGRATQARTQLDDDPNFIILEFAKLGSLDKWLSKAGSLGIRRNRAHFPRVIAWKFFDCLVKGCMAMEEPPRYQTANKNSPDDQLPLPQLVPDGQRRYLPETIQPDDAGDDRRIVHLDLDPQNVLLPGLDEPSDGLDPSHNYISRLQISDFGAAKTRDALQRVPTTRMERVEGVYAQRGAGKTAWSLPEQWTAEWDDIGPNSDPYTEPQYKIIAGNYDSHSNVWHIGMIMRCLLFLEQPPQVPEADRVRAFEAGRRPVHAGSAGGSPPPAAAVGAGAIEPEDEFWTCGAEVLQDCAVVRMYGARLCQLVARCLAYVPAHRPSLPQIQREIDVGLAEAAAAADPGVVSGAGTEGGGQRRRGGGGGVVVSQADADFFFDPPVPLPAVAGGRPMDTDIWAEFL